MTRTCAYPVSVRHAGHAAQALAVLAASLSVLWGPRALAHAPLSRGTGTRAGVPAGHDVCSTVDRPDTPDPAVRDVPVGLEPSAITVDGPRRRAFVLNRVSYVDGQRTSRASVSVLNVATGRAMRTAHLDRDLVATGPMAVDERDGHLLILTARAQATTPPPSRPADGLLTLLDAATGRPLRTVPVAPYRGPIDLAIDARRGHILVLAANDAIDAAGHVGLDPQGRPVGQGVVVMLDAATATVLRTIPSAWPPPPSRSTTPMGASSSSTAAPATAPTRPRPMARCSPTAAA